MLDHAANAGRHALKQRGDDTYSTPPEATRALLRHETLPGRVWEPACGFGAISEVLKHETCCDVWATDLVDHGYDCQTGIDFLMERSANGCEAVITNPPFKLADEFVRHALTLVPKVVMLLRLAFLESAGRSDILDGGQLARVHVFKNRLPMMHRTGWTGPRSTSSIPYAWFIWSKDHNGPTTINRISWKP